MVADMAGDCCRELESQIIQFAAGLHALKLQAGDKVSIEAHIYLRVPRYNPSNAALHVGACHAS